jgi:hypothetical protein
MLPVKKEDLNQLVETPNPLIRVPPFTMDMQVLATFIQFMQDPNETEMYISGPGGTGKTSILAHLVNVVANAKLPYLVGAYTHKACNVLREKIYAEAGEAKIRVSTLHSFLKKAPGINDLATDRRQIQITNRQGKPEQVKVLFFDEYSMIGEEDYFDLGEVQADEYGRVLTKIVYIGDNMQLPPVKSARAIYPRGKYQVWLSKNHRADDCLQPVLDTLRQMKETGKITKLPEADCVHRKADIVSEYINKHRDNNCVLLAYTNKRVDYLNAKVHQILYGRAAPDNGDDIFIAAHKLYTKLVMINDFSKPILNKTKLPTEYLKNSNDILDIQNDKYNSIPKVEGMPEVEKVILPHPVNKDKAVFKLVVFENSRYKEIENELQDLAVHSNKMIMTETGISDKKELLDYCRNNYDDPLVRQRAQAWSKYLAFNQLVTALSLPYASTVHKAQGSTVDYVMIDGVDLLRLYKNNVSEYLSLFYTAVSRARHGVYINN